MIRSAEVTRNMPKAKKGPKVIAHIEVHPQMGGGVMVEHHHTDSMAHPMETHRFAEHEGGKFADHMMEHSGMSWEGGEPEEEKEANAGPENEVENEDNLQEA